MRENMIPGQTLTLKSGETFRILDCIGKGASVLCYDAEQLMPLGSPVRCRLKECFPNHETVHRSGTCVVWDDPSVQQTFFDRFMETNEQIQVLRTDPRIGNQIPDSHLLEGNGTLYQVTAINHGVLMSEEPDESLYTTLEAVLVLTRIIGKLHEMKYLHLDIKPDNLLISYHPSIQIWLLDVDSLVRTDQQGRPIGSVSLTDQWAAPEQRRGMTWLIGPATDVYGVGAILFYRLTRRPVSIDEIGVFSEISLDEAVFKDFNPSARQCVLNLLRRSLSCSVKRRYQSMSEFEADLSKALSRLDPEMPYLVSNCPSPVSGFTGRAEELDAIHHLMQQRHRVILQGMGGIGKTELVKRYAVLHADEYETILFVSGENGIQSALESIPVYHGESRDLPNLLTHRVLLIIDNADLPVECMDLDAAENIHADILLTTRTDLSLVGSLYNFSQMHIQEMPAGILAEMFHTLCPGYRDPEEDLHELLKTVQWHTYMTELCARYMAVSGLSTKDLLCQLTEGYATLENQTQVLTVKDAKVRRRSIPDTLRALFKLRNLTSAERQVLRNLALLSHVQMDLPTYRRIALKEPSELTALSVLVDEGWVQKVDVSETSGSVSYNLHPLVREIVFSDDPPSLENCRQVCSFVNGQIWKRGSDHGGTRINQLKWKTIDGFLLPIFNRIPIGDEAFAVIRNWADACSAEGPDGDYSTLPAELTESSLFQHLRSYADSCTSPYWKLSALTILDQAWINSMTIFRSDPEKQQQVLTLGVDLFKASIMTIFDLDEEDQMEAMIRILDLYMEANRAPDYMYIKKYMGKDLRKFQLPDEIVDLMAVLDPSKLNWIQKRERGIPLEMYDLLKEAEAQSVHAGPFEECTAVGENAYLPDHELAVFLDQYESCTKLVQEMKIHAYEGNHNKLPDLAEAYYRKRSGIRIPECAVLLFKPAFIEMDSIVCGLMNDPRLTGYMKTLYEMSVLSLERVFGDHEYHVPSNVIFNSEDAVVYHADISSITPEVNSFRNVLESLKEIPDFDSVYTDYSLLIAFMLDGYHSATENYRDMVANTIHFDVRSFLILTQNRGGLKETVRRNREKALAFIEETEEEEYRLINQRHLF